MSVIKIFTYEQNEEIEKEAIERGCRLDILVYMNNKYYHPVFYEEELLINSCRYELKYNSTYYCPSKDLIVVKDVSMKNIINIILKLKDEKFFSFCREIDLEKEYKMVSRKLTNIMNWDLVYSNEK